LLKSTTSYQKLFIFYTSFYYWIDLGGINMAYGRL
jgi:hypothetical protein